jgi:lipopolysaccharide export system protein LptA
MRRSEATRYARWSAAVALLLAGVTVAVYLQRGWARHIEKSKAPPAAPSDVTRLSSGLTFSKVEQNRTIFTVQASKSTEFKDKDASLLEDVKITIFGKTGERHDTIHTQSCQYGQEKGDVICSGLVQIELQSAADADRAESHPQEIPSPAVHVETHGVIFDRASGEAHTDQRVLFTFPSGRGEAVGVEYNSEEGMVWLWREVRMTLAPPAARGTAKKPNGDASTEEEVHVKGTRLDFGRDTRRMHLAGPVDVETRSQHLTSGELTLSLDAGFRAEKLVATAGAHGAPPNLTSQGVRGPMEITADRLTAGFAPQGWMKNLEAAGNAHGSRKIEGEDDSFSADSATMDLWPGVNKLKELNLTGAVSLQSQFHKTGETRKLQTTALHMIFSGGTADSRTKMQRVETLAPGTIEWTAAAPQVTGLVNTKVTADRLAMDFDEQGKPKELQATGNVQTERAIAGRPTQTATSRSGIAQLLPDGGWSQMDLQGDVKLKEGDRSGQADHVTFQRAAQTALLTGQPVVRDSTTETRASRITFVQTTGDIRAEGAVRSTDFSAKDSRVQFAPLPLNITADRLLANSRSGRALYSGHARLWQGDSVLEADTIELLKATKVLNAAGKVRAVFPQLDSRPAASENALHSAPKKTQLWHTSAEILTYSDVENRAHLERNVIVESAEQTIRASSLDLYFVRGGPSARDASNVNSGARQINRAVGTGGVIVEQGLRRATADRGEYTAADGKFIMSGGNPTLFDGSAGTTTGRQLTFFLADDTIIVDSETGSRTLTKHRVEK